MKLSVRILAVFLCLTALLSFTACKQVNEETPVGMMIASCSGADYRLYVPNTWVLNTSYGVSGAYRVLSQQSTVSVNRYPTADYTAKMEADSSLDLADATGRLNWFYQNVCLEPVRKQALDGKVEQTDEDKELSKPAVVDEINAMQYCHRALINGKTLRFLQVVMENNQAFYVLTFTATEEMFEMYLPDVNRMVETFIFADPYVPEDFAKHLDSGKDAPQGMIPAFGDDVAYKFYVPDTWKLRMDDSVYSAYVEADKSSVSVVPYLPETETMSVQQYFDMSREMMEKMGGTDGFELISDSEKVTLGGRQATVYEYRFRIGGVFYHYKQYVAAYRSMIYSLTYTATEEVYPTHLAELDAIVSAFAFR